MIASRLKTTAFVLSLSTAGCVTTKLPISEPAITSPKIFAMPLSDAQELQLFREKNYLALIEYYQKKLDSHNLSSKQYGICQFRLAIAYLGNGEVEKAYDTLGPVIPFDDSHLDSMYFLIRFFIKEAIISLGREFGEVNDSLVQRVFNFPRPIPDVNLDFKLHFLHFLSIKDFTYFLQLGGSKYDTSRHPISIAQNPDVLFTKKVLDLIAMDLKE